MSVGVMKDYKLKLRKLSVSHTLGWPWNWKVDQPPSREPSWHPSEKNFIYLGPVLAGFIFEENANLNIVFGYCDQKGVFV